MARLLLVTGFGPFFRVARNASAEVARALAATPPAGWEVAARELPVTFAGAPPALEAALAELAPRLPDLLLSLGVHRKGWFRLERRARPRLTSAKPDNEGVRAASLGPVGETERATTLDLELLAGLLVRAGAPEVRVSEDAGGFVCERTYLAALEAGERERFPALFLHLPPADLLDPGRQAAILRRFFVALDAEGARAGLA